MIAWHLAPGQHASAGRSLMNVRGGCGRPLSSLVSMLEQRSGGFFQAVGGLERTVGSKFRLDFDAAI
jgi:hypothetical protein